MKNGFKKLIKPLSIGIVAATGLGLTISALVMLSRHSDTVNELSRSQAQLNTEQSRKSATENIDNYILKAANIASRISEKGSELELLNLLAEIKTQDSEIWKISYFNGDYIYNEQGEGTHKLAAQDLAFAYRSAGKSESAYLGSFNEKISQAGDETMERFEFYAPVVNCPYFVDGVSVYYSYNEVTKFMPSTAFNKDCSFGAFFNDSDQHVIYGYKDSEEFPCTSRNFIENLRLFVGTKTVTDEVENLIKTKTTGTIFCKNSGKDYVVSVYCSEKLANLMVAEVYSCDVLNPTNKTLINSIISIIALFVAIIIATVAYFIIQQARLRKQLTDSESTNILLGSLNRHGFEKEANDILTRQNGTYYGVIICELRHFKYLNETYGEQEVHAILRHLKTITNQTVKLEETYGYADNGDFLILMHAKDKADLIDKLKIHSFLCAKYKGGNKIQISLKYGIYEHFANDTTPISKMIDFAREANNAIVKASVENVDMQFNFYDDELRKIRILNEDMELRQETALKNGEFQVFYQAKYNLKKQRQDGAEALVRWYNKDTGEYELPGLFMPLFESNGFIEKLDKYVYTKVCEYISYSIAQGRHVYPVSVNVSRITATQPDFIDFYTKLKKKYGIANSVITVEFTESFAYENYDVLKNIVNKLHENGFECSIDDFGCGYSSYRILKELPMDEIKLDKFFIDRSDEPERINSIYESVISLAKKLNMKVTQEGVERSEDVEILKSHGCDVVQGFIYSKPIPLTDYLHFCEESHNHKL